MSGVYVCGWGVTSPAGWGLPALRAALEAGQPLPTTPLVRPGWDHPFQVRMAPNPSPKPAFMSHPRLRRASPITHYATAAALEALGVSEVTAAPALPRLGIILCLQSGCVQYSYRFFDEVLRDPQTASPLVFPETVFNAPISHIAALLGHVPLTCTLVGDPATFLQGVALATDWLLDQRVDGCLVISAEEMNWLLADALWHFDRGAILAVGAGALYLARRPELSLGVELTEITDVFTYSTRQNRHRAALQMRAQLPPESAGELLCDGRQGRPKTDAPERAAWRDWAGPRLSPKSILGEGLAAAAAWQCAAACDALAQKRFRAANVSLVGCNQQAIGARFEAI